MVLVLLLNSALVYKFPIFLHHLAPISFHSVVSTFIHTLCFPPCPLSLSAFSPSGAGLWATWPTIHPSPKPLNPSFYASAGPPKRTFPPIFLFHLFLIILLSFNTIFNFLLAALRPAGPVPLVTFGVAADVPAGQSMRGYQLVRSVPPAVLPASS